MNNHRKLVGMSPSESDLALLETARRCDFYGVKFHPARDIEGTPVNLAILHLGIRVYHQLACASTFSWAKIRKMSFKRKKFLIKLHPEAYHYYKDTIEFHFETRNESKAFWKKAVEHHTFFRFPPLIFSPGSAICGGQGKLFSKGSSFRYNGRTQKQLIDYVREHHKRREPFTRPIHSSFTRAGLGGSGGTSGGRESDRSLPTPLIPLRPNGNGDLNGHSRLRPYDSSPANSIGSPGRRGVGSPTTSASAVAGPSEDDVSEGHHYVSASRASQPGSTTVSFHVPTSTPHAVSRAPAPYPPPLSSPVTSPGHATTFGASHNSARTTLASPSSSIPISNGKQHPPPELARSLVLSNAAASTEDDKHQTGTSWPPHQALTIHGYLSADADDNLSEDSYHLSDQEVLPGSLERRAKAAATSASPTSPRHAGIGVPAYPPSSPESSPKRRPVLSIKKSDPELPHSPPDVGMPPKFPPEDASLYSSVKPVAVPHPPSSKPGVSFLSSPPSEKKTPPTSPPGSATTQPLSTFASTSSRTLPYGPRITYPEPKLMAPDSGEESSATAYDNLTYASLEPRVKAVSVEKKPSPPPPPPKPTSPLPSQKAAPPPVPEKPKTYGAVGPSPGRIIASDKPIVIMAGKSPGPKPLPPPKPKVHLIKPIVLSQDSGPQEHPPPDAEQKTAQFTSPKMPEIAVQPVDRPDIQHKFLLNGDVPYVLHMRHVSKTEDIQITEKSSSTSAAPFSTFRDPDQSNKERGRTQRSGVSPTASSSTAMPRLRKKSLDLVPRKRLPSPAAFSSQDHSVSPTTPESGNVLDYLMRRRSASQEAKARRAAKRAEGRRKTQPVRFRLADEAEGAYAEDFAPLKSSSQPELPIQGDLDSGDEEEEELSLDSHSLHEDMDALERLDLASNRASASSLEDGGGGGSHSASLPPPPPPLSLDSAPPPMSVYDSQPAANAVVTTLASQQPHTTDF